MAADILTIDGQFRKAFHILIPRRRLTSPIACAISSTRRVDTPPIQASWMTATNAFSVVLRASRNGGK
jgi:hypothetical protein